MSERYDNQRHSDQEYHMLSAKLINRDKRIEELKKESSQRGARMQIMRRWITTENWTRMLEFYPQAKDWFDAYGVPALEVSDE